MGPHCIVLVAAVILLISVTASASLDTSIPQVRSFGIFQNGAPPTRLLRIRKTPSEGSEERAITGLDKLTDMFQASALKVADIMKLRSWWFRGDSVDDVFAKLKLNEGLEDAIVSANLESLRKYVDMVKSSNPNSQVSVVGALMAHYGDFVVTEALMTARKARSTRGIAGPLQLQQLKTWLANGKSTDEVFSILKITDDGPKSLMSWEIETMNDYTRYVNEKKPELKTNFFKVYRSGFGGDDKYPIMVSKAMEIPEAQYFASQNQNWMFKQWLKSGIEPRDALTTVFKIAKKDLTDAGPRESPLSARTRRRARPRSNT